MGLVNESQVQEALALQQLTGNRLGEALLSLGYLTRPQLQRALSEALSDGSRVPLERPPLGEILVGLRYLEPKQLETALEMQRRAGRRLGELLVEQKTITHEQLYEALSLQERMATPTISRDEAVELVNANGVKVMVVDDSPLAVNLVQNGLRMLGFSVDTFTNPFEALEQVHLTKPNIVLTDLEMPGLDGAELCRRLKDTPGRSLPVIILTANDAETQRVGLLRAGADDYVNKGCSMEELSARIESILRRTKETEHVRKLFGRYTSDAIVDELLKQKEIVLTGEKREVTVLFADLRHFTSMAEELPAEEVMTLLNAVLGRLADVVLVYGGTLDKFLGDGLMAIFGAPVHQPDHPFRAAQAGLQMVESVKQLNASGQFPAVELGVGVNTGSVIVGSLGSTKRTEYTCIGDAVNVASRLCGLAGPMEVLAGETTVAKGVGSGVSCEALPPARLKGKSKPVALYRLTPGNTPDLAQTKEQAKL
jgi:adenylate cyclase